MERKILLAARAPYEAPETELFDIQEEDFILYEGDNGTITPGEGNADDDVY